MELRFTNSQGPGRPTFRITSNAFDETITLTPATGASSSPVPLAITQADLTTNQIQPIVYTTQENGKPKTITGNAAIKAVNVLDTTSNVLGEFLLLLMIPDVVANPTDFNEVHVFSGASGQSLTVAGTPLMDNRIAQTTNLNPMASKTSMTIGIINVTKVKGVSPDADFLWLAKWRSQQLRLPGDDSTSFPVWAIVLLSIAAVCVVIGATFLIVHSLRANSVEESIDNELRGGAIYAL